jgi:hypothetical protein
MRDAFFLGVILVIPITLLVAMLYSVGRFLWSMYTDVRLYHELDQIEAQSGSRREQKAVDNAKRLENGCEHRFDSALGGFPPGVCAQCGLARQRPPGLCDHVWRRTAGTVMGSRCEKCGKEYRAAE